MVSWYEHHMPRKSRIDALRALHHIVAGGIDRINIFKPKLIGSRFQVPDSRFKGYNRLKLLKIFIKIGMSATPYWVERF